MGAVRYLRRPGYQLCCAHALRELQAVADAAPHGQWCWATQAADAIAAMQQLVREAVSQGRDAADPAALATQVRLFRSAVLAGASHTAARSGALMKKHNALARRLRDYLRFTSDFRALPDNNGTERDIRMAKLKQKVSGCLRIMTGARQFCAIRTYLSTAVKRGLGSFDALVMLTEGEPWMPAAARSDHNDFSDLTSYTLAWGFLNGPQRDGCLPERIHTHFQTCRPSARVHNVRHMHPRSERRHGVG